MPVDQKVLSSTLHQGMVYVHHRPVLPFLTFNCSQDPEERRKESGSKVRNRDSGQMGEFSSRAQPECH